MSPAPVARLGPDGIDLPAALEDRLHLRLDGRRIWSFLPLDHGVARRRRRQVAWPPALALTLDGPADLSLHDDDGTELGRAEVRFGTGPGPARLVDPSGNLMSLDHRGRLVGTFEEHGDDAVAELVGATATVLDTLTGYGVHAFLAYGTLLGAVRDGHVIGHDTDADVGYVSEHTQPVDVVRESFALQRRLHAEGFRIRRYSGAAMQIGVEVSGGRFVGLDVFGGYFEGDVLALMGEVYAPFERSWLLPLGEVVLEGRALPAPARPERLLEVMYGPSWRVPDPTFKFTTPRDVVARYNGLFRGMRTHRNRWDRRYSTGEVEGPQRMPHDLARHLHAEEPEGTAVVEIGCGRGQDAMWLAHQGRSVHAFDFSPSAYAVLRRRAEHLGLDLRFSELNLLDTRQVLTAGARLSLDPRPKAVLARHVLDATTHRGRRRLMKLAATLLRDGGRLYLDFMTTADPPWPAFGATKYVDELVTDMNPTHMADLAERQGGRVVSSGYREVSGYELPDQPVPGSPPPRACRMVVEWGA